MSLMLTQPSSTAQCLKTKLSISANLLATQLKERKTLFGNWAKHSMAESNLVTFGIRNLKAFLSRLVSMLANLIHAFSSTHHHLPPPSSHLMLMILVSSVTLLLKSDYSNHRFTNTSPSKT